MNHQDYTINLIDFNSSSEEKNRFVDLSAHPAVLATDDSHSNRRQSSYNQIEWSTKKIH
jgi:hypothetical protein